MALNIQHIFLVLITITSLNTQMESFLNIYCWNSSNVELQRLSLTKLPRVSYLTKLSENRKIELSTVPNILKINNQTVKKLDHHKSANKI